MIKSESEYVLEALDRLRAEVSAQDGIAAVPVVMTLDRAIAEVKAALDQRRADLRAESDRRVTMLATHNPCDSCADMGGVRSDCPRCRGLGWVRR